jgi:hypothetical protein
VAHDVGLAANRTARAFLWVVRAFGTSNYRKALRVGDRYQLRFERAGVERSAFLTTSHSNTLLMARLSWFLVSLVWCAIGLFMGFVRPDRPMARLAFVTAMAVGFVFVQVSLFSIPTIYQPLHVVLGYHFFYRFPGAIPLGGFWTARSGCSTPPACCQLESA